MYLFTYHIFTFSEAERRKAPPTDGAIKQTATDLKAEED